MVGHVEKTSECRLTYELYKACVNGTVHWGRPRLTYADQVGSVLTKSKKKGNKEHLCSVMLKC